LFACKNAEYRKLPYYNTADFTPTWIKNKEVADTIHKIAAFEFTDQDGENINNDSFSGRIYVANFFFTSCPSICPKMMKNMKKVADSFSKNGQVKFISFSVTPEIDSVPRLKRYADGLNIKSSQWYLVTGRHADIYTLARKSYFAEEDIGFNKDSSEFLHTEHLVLVDKAGHIRGLYNGTVDLEMQRLCEDINQLLNE
jgi:protein SCO1/2